MSAGYITGPSQEREVFAASPGVSETESQQEHALLHVSWRFN